MGLQRPVPNPPYGLSPEAWGAVVAVMCCGDGPQTRYGPLASSGYGMGPMVEVPLSWVVALRDRVADMTRLMEAGKDASWKQA